METYEEPVVREKDLEFQSNLRGMETGWQFEVCSSGLKFQSNLRGMETGLLRKTSSSLFVSFNRI